MHRPRTSTNHFVGQSQFVANSIIIQWAGMDEYGDSALQTNPDTSTYNPVTPHNYINLCAKSPIVRFYRRISSLYRLSR